MGLLSLLINKKLEKRIAAIQGDMLNKYYDEVQGVYYQMRGWKHDFHNHIQTINAYLELGEIDNAKEYLKKLEVNIKSVDTIVKTDNIMLDAILNSKLSYIKSKNVTVNAKASVPENMPVSDLDLCIIIGNLLDNALEACLKFEDISNAYIRIYIGILKGQLYISVTNPVCSDLKRIGKKFISTKNSDSHGFGIVRIDNVVEKYNGYVNRQCEANMFVTEIMIPLIM